MIKCTRDGRKQKAIGHLRDSGYTKMKYLRISLQRGRFFIGASTLTEIVQRQEKRLLFSRTTFLPKGPVNCVQF